MIKPLVDFLSANMSGIQIAFLKCVIVLIPVFFSALDLYYPPFASKDTLTQCIYSIGVAVFASLYGVFITMFSCGKNGLHLVPFMYILATLGYSIFAVILVAFAVFFQVCFIFNIAGLVMTFTIPGMVFALIANLTTPTQKDYKP